MDWVGTSGRWDLLTGVPQKAPSNAVGTGIGRMERIP